MGFNSERLSYIEHVAYRQTVLRIRYCRKYEICQLLVIICKLIFLICLEIFIS